MSTIIAGHFQLQEQAALAVEALTRAGYPADRVSSFFVNPAGQHDTFAVGGDRDKSPGAQDTDKGVAAGVGAGAAAGAAVGVVSAPVTGPLGAVLGGLVGGHVGGLVGTLASTDEGHPAERRASGMLVAVEVGDDHEERRAIDVLRQAHAEQIERGQGHISGGDWRDFDPLSAPHLLGY